MKSLHHLKCLLAYLSLLLPVFLYAAPGNDLCGAPTPITSRATCSNTGSTLVAATWTAFTTSCGSGRPDVWFIFTAQTTNPTITVSGLSNARIQVLTLASCGGTVGSMGCIGSASGTVTGLIVNTQYLIRVYQSSGTATAFNICVTDPAPSNNVCSGATPLTGGLTCTNTNGIFYASNVSGSSPTITGSCAGTVTGDLWYSFVSTTTNPVIKLSNLGTSVTNAGVELLTGDCTAMTSIACGTSNISATDLTVGSTYYIRVFTTGTVPTALANSGFSICVTYSPPENDDCLNAVPLLSTSICTPTQGILTYSTYASFTGACGTANSHDVWYTFVANSYTQTVTLTNSPSQRSIQIFDGTCGSLNSVQCAVNNATLTAGSLTIGKKYYIRVWSDNNSNGTFGICVTGGSSRMNEVFQPTILSAANVLNDPWEVTYGPDNHLWITEAKGYKVYRMDPSTGTKTTILDLSNGSTFLPSPSDSLNVQFTTAQNPWPQGGMAGLAIHPMFMDPVTPKKFVYVSYIHRFLGGASPNGLFYRNKLVRFTYNTGTGKLESPVVLCDTLPGSKDHNSQRIIIAPVAKGGTYYLFYGSGDMGSGQFENRLRPNKAQNVNSYEGKILRFNLESDGDPNAEAWIPNDNPYSATSAVYDMGIRNNQGFAYDTALNILYGSSHGPFSDDEINIIERKRNYGHPLVIGKADGNANGTTAGSAPNMSGGSTSTCPMITDEVAAAAAIPNYQDPIFAGYPSSAAFPSLNNLWATTDGTNGQWPSEAWSGLDLYTHTLIPGWKKSLIAASLKWGRLVRIKLNATGTATAPTNTVADTISYFGSINRYRDIAFAPNGKDIYVIMDKSTTTSGPSAQNPVVPACPGCLIKYTFLGYTDLAGKSTIPESLDITTGTAGTCNPGTTVTVDNTNNNLWVPITGPDGNIMAEIFPNGNNLGTVISSFYINGSSTVRTDVAGRKFMDRNMTITPAVQPSSAVKIRLYITNTEFAALQTDPLSGITSLSNVLIRKNSDPCGANQVLPTTNFSPTVAEAHGTVGYVLQYDNLTSFSSFYLGSNSIILPVTLLDFKGILQNNITLLQWQTANETNTSSFIIERSIDSRNFVRIGTVPAHGDSKSTIDYMYTDYDVMKQSSEVVYYRLKMVDRDNNFRYSKVISVTIPFITGRVTVFPNPATNDVNVSVSAPAEGIVKWKLMDNTGRLIIHNNMQMRKGNNSFSIDLNSVSAGVYYLIVSGAGIEQQVKLQKL